MEARRRALEARPGLVREFLERLSRVLGARASVIVFGGRARSGLDTDEPRDLDVLVVFEDWDDPAAVEQLVYSVKPRRLPVDVVVARRSELGSLLAREMLRHRVVVHDPLGVAEELEGRG